MFSLHDEESVDAPLDRVFALATRVELVAQTLGLHVVSGVARGHISSGSRVVWRGWKFGLPATHHTLITGFVAPHLMQHGAATSDEADLESELATAAYADLLKTGLALPEALEEHAATLARSAFFQDTQERGRFAHFQHDHWFFETAGPDGSPRTRMEDHVRFALPFGLAGQFVAKHIVVPHVRSLLRQRFVLLKTLAEGDDWQKWVIQVATDRNPQ